MTKIIAPKVPRFIRSQSGFLRRLASSKLCEVGPPDRSIMPTAKSIAKAVMPKRELGKPKMEDCGEVATDVQLTNGFRLQGNSTPGFTMSLITSTVNMKEAEKPMIEPIIKM